MEAVVKFKIIDGHEEDWMLAEYAKGKFENLTDEDLTEIIDMIISYAIEDNKIYFDCNDADDAAREMLPIISAIILNPRCSHIRSNYNVLVEMVTYLTFRLG